jgi:hypothetical protein
MNYLKNFIARGITMKQHITVSQLQKLNWENIADIADALEMSYINLDNMHEEIAKRLTISKLIELLNINSYFFSLTHVNDEWIAEVDSELGTLSATAYDEPCDALWELLKIDLDEWSKEREEDV